jgi:hypothetical protein
MKSAKDRPSDDLAEPVDRPTAWRILGESQIRPHPVVVLTENLIRTGLDEKTG